VFKCTISTLYSESLIYSLNCDCCATLTIIINHYFVGSRDHFWYLITYNVRVNCCYCCSVSRKHLTVQSCCEICCNLPELWDRPNSWTLRRIFVVRHRSKPKHVLIAYHITNDAIIFHSWNSLYGGGIQCVNWLVHISRQMRTNSQVRIFQYYQNGL